MRKFVTNWKYNSCMSFYFKYDTAIFIRVNVLYWRVIHGIILTSVNYHMLFVKQKKIKKMTVISNNYNENNE